MAKDTKLAFSALEAELIQNSEWILTKQLALHKIELLLAAQIPVIQSLIPSTLLSFPELAAARPKISRGEKYLGLPWLMLDYPSCFSKTDVFALRTMFWWGHFFSVVLHVSGKYKYHFEQQLLERIQKSEHPFHVQTGPKEWDHHFHNNNFIPAATAIRGGFGSPESSVPFFKVGLVFPLKDWEKMGDHLRNAYAAIFELVEEH